MRMQFGIVIQICLTIACIYCLLMVYIDRPRLRLATNANFKVPTIIPIPTIYGRQTKDDPRNENLAIVEVVSARGRIEEYRTAIGSVQCYAQLKGHYMYLLDIDDYSAICNHHEDFFYKRHCVTLNLMQTTNHSWYAFIDSDMEVVNPNGSFFNYIDDKFDVILYDRFWNWEIVAGSFILKGSQFGRDFIRRFANFEWEHPQIASHGTDNGAIQALVAEIVLHGRDKILDCWDLWRASKGWDDIFVHEWCIRKAMGAREEWEQVKIFRKGTAWARDGSLTDGKWSPEVDFLLHGRKEKQKKAWNPKMGEYWYDTRMEPLDLEKCRDLSYQWNVRKELLINKTQLYKKLKTSAQSVKPYLRSVFTRSQKAKEIEFDFVNNTDIVQHFTNFII